MTANPKKLLRTILLVSASIVVVLAMWYVHSILTNRLVDELADHLIDNYHMDTYFFVFETEEALEAYLTNIVTDNLNRSMFLRRVNVSFLDSAPEHVPIENLIEYFQLDLYGAEALEGMIPKIGQHIESQSLITRTISAYINNRRVVHISNIYPADWFKSLFN